MSSEVEVLEGGVSKEAVFGGQERGDQSGGLFVGLRDRIRLGDQTFRVCNLQSLPVPYIFTGFTPQRPQHPSLNVSTPNLYRRALKRMSSEVHPLHRSSNQQNQIASLESVPVIRSPYHTPAPRSLHFSRSHSEGSSIEKYRRQSGKKRTMQSRRASFAVHHPATTADRLDAM